MTSHNLCWSSVFFLFWVLFCVVVVVVVVVVVFCSEENLTVKLLPHESEKAIT